MKKIGYLQVLSVLFYCSSLCTGNLNSDSKTTKKAMQRHSKKWYFKHRINYNHSESLQSSDWDNAKSFKKALPFGIKDCPDGMTDLTDAISSIKNYFESKRNSETGLLQCAVVGSGGALKESGQGKGIDNHDIVIRFNRAPTVGYEQDVGKKTDIRVVYPESFFREGDEYMLFVLYKPADAQWLWNILSGNDAQKGLNMKKQFFRPDTTPVGRVNLSPSDVGILNPLFFQHIQHVLRHQFQSQGKRPTSGVLLTSLAIHLCNATTLYGFGLGPNMEIHYYKDGEIREKAPLGIHDIVAEREFEALLQENELLLVDELANDIHGHLNEERLAYVRGKSSVKKVNVAEQEP